MNVYYNMPTPFELFTKKEKEADENKNKDKNKAGNKMETKIETKEGMKNIIEGNANRTDFGAITTAPLAGQPNKNVELTSVLVGVFFILTLLLGLIYYFNSIFLLLDSLMEPIYGPQKKEFYTESNFNDYFGGRFSGQFYFIFFVLWMIVFCLNILIFQVVLDVNDYGMMFYMTTVYFFSIVGGTLVVINNVPSLVEVFENTLGTWMLDWISNKKSVVGMFKQTGFDPNKQQVKDLGLKMDLGFLLTTFTMANFHEHFDKLFAANPESKSADTNVRDTAFYIDVSIFDPDQRPDKDSYMKDSKSDVANRARYNLLRLVLQKYTIGHYIWIVLASYVSILLAVNTMPYT